MVESAIELHEVSFTYGETPVLEGVSLRVDPGEFLGLVGPNGSGKSTLLKLILGLLKPTAGQISVLERPPRAARGRVGYVPQYASFSRDFPITVEETILLGRLGKTLPIWGYQAQDRKAAWRAMQEMEVTGLRDRPLAALSGGQLQRVLVARALIGDPELLLLDEPTAHIDIRKGKDLFDALQAINRRLTIVVVSHDLGFIMRYITRVAILNRNLVSYSANKPRDELLQHLYSHCDTPIGSPEGYSETSV